VAARITVHAPGLAAVTQIVELPLAHITMQPTPGGRFLVAGARCRWRPGGPDPNAVLYDTGGQPVSAHVLGDGLAHLQATSTGHLWAGYFDEGIYGNYGWGRDGTAPPVGAPGIIRFSPPCGMKMGSMARGFGAEGHSGPRLRRRADGRAGLTGCR